MNKAVALDTVPIELQEALWVAISEEDKKTLQSLFAKGKRDQQIAEWLSNRRGRIDTFQTSASWEQAASILRAQFYERGYS